MEYAMPTNTLVLVECYGQSFWKLIFNFGQFVFFFLKVK